MLPRKPKFGEPCNRCGYCCSEEICAIGKKVYPFAKKAPCPALEISEDGKRTYCLFVAAEIYFKQEPIIQRALGIGKGCCSDG